MERQRGRGGDDDRVNVLPVEKNHWTAPLVSAGVSVGWCRLRFGASRLGSLFLVLD
jgi:hypothetical protein